MTLLARRRLLQLGLGAGTSALAALPAESFAKAKHHATLQKASLHRTAQHGVHGHGRHATMARQTLHPHGHAHDRSREYAHAVQQTDFRFSSDPRRLNFHNLHTDEKLDAVYWEDGHYVPDALHAVNHVLRDFRTGDVHMIDPGLLDLLVAVRAKTETQSPFYVISGYRSPQTNAMLRDEGGAATGVARKSMHLEGKAIDLRLGDVQLAHLHNAALSLGGGGVGYYPTSDFVHMDVGPVRQWGGV
jgi:uncharacterized protein YcbK (DUF882 family)